MAEPPARVRFAVLGPVVVRTAGRVLAPGSAVRRALLGLLLLADGQPLPPDRLLRAVWGDEPPDTGRGAVHVAVSRLRSWLDRNVGGGVELAHEAGGYRLQARGASLDAAAFRALVAASARAAAPEARIRHLCDALALWRGPAVADGTAWLGTDVLVRRIEGLRVEAACALADAAVAARQPEHAVSWLEAAAGDNPLDERAQAALAVTLAVVGRQVEGLAVVERARTRLADELGLDPGPQLRDAHLRILRQQLVPPPPDGRRATAGGTGGRVPPVPMQLPPGSAEFTGRAAELTELRRRLRGAAAGPPPAVAIAAIVGAPGVGKSALAVHLAHGLASEYPDGLLYLDLSAHGAGRPPPLPALARLLRALGADTDRLPGDLEAATVRYRSLLAGRRVLVVLDNAADTAQVRHLLPATAGCAAVVTSRAQLADLDGAVPSSLDLPPERDALTLLARIAGPYRVAAEADAAAAIVACCGRLPLAVRIAGSRLRSRPGWPLAELAARLAPEHRRLDELTVGDLDVRASIGRSYRALPPLVARTFRLLALLDDHDVTPAAATALAGNPTAAVHLEQLADAHLLDSPGPGRYRLHPLVRLFARERARADGLDPAGQDGGVVSTTTWMPSRPVSSRRSR